jgi:hypothetical protein
MKKSPQFEVGRTYTRPEISHILGGSIRTYLPMVQGQIVCGCFKPTPRYNPAAPEKITISRIHRIEPRQMSKQVEPIPVFLFRAPCKWEYRGRYRCSRFSTDRSLVKKEMRANPARGEINGVLYFERVGD